MRLRFLPALLPWLFLSVACSSNSSDSNTVVRWPAMPVTIYASPSMIADAATSADLQQAMSFWEAQAGKKLFDYQGAWKGDLTNTDNLVAGSLSNPTNILVNLIYFPASWPFDSTYAGKTAVHYENSTIEHSLVMLNINMAFCHADCAAATDLGAVSERKAIAHELGHFLGFPHNSDVNNIMFPTIQPGGDLSSVSVDTGLLQALTD